MQIINFRIDPDKPIGHHDRALVDVELRADEVEDLLAFVRRPDRPEEGSRLDEVVRKFAAFLETARDELIKREGL